MPAIDAGRAILIGSAAALLAGLLVPVPASAEDPVRHRWLAFTQLAADRVSGADDTFELGADRIRPRFQIDTQRLTAAVQLDLAVDDPDGRRPGSITNGVLDLFVDYRFLDRHAVRFGEFKTPLGMDFNLPAHSLDITKRGMDNGLVLNRDFGLMLRGQAFVEGLSYNIGLFNPAGRSQATQYVDAQVGHDVTAVGRLLYDRGEWHAELARGESENAGGPGSTDYEVTNFAIRFRPDAWTLKAEWTDSRHVRGIEDRKERVYYLHGGYRLSPTLELVARHYAGRSRIGATATDLSNTHLGFAKRFGESERLQTRLQVNYVVAGGDGDAYTGLRGFRNDALLVQLQIFTSGP
jgi:hypothetical protein